jgi:hypothetical protein
MKFIMIKIIMMQIIQKIIISKRKKFAKIKVKIKINQFFKKGNLLFHKKIKKMNSKIKR